MDYFNEIVPNIIGNKKLREPQIEAYLKIKEYFTDNPDGEALVVLPTGTGKSGLISIAPYGVAHGRVLVITPGLVTKKSVVKTLHPLEDNFWLNCDVLLDPEDLPVVEEYSSEMLKSSLDKCDFVIANVHKLYSSSANSLLKVVPSDFFDMVIIDEAHHSAADSWRSALEYFNSAKKLHVTGTPYRGDHREIPGEEIHNTPLSEVMALRYVKWLRKASTNNNDMYFQIPGDPTKYTKDQVLVLKEREWVEKSVALSKECSMEVIEQSIDHLNKLKEFSPHIPHKILAVACSINHAEDVAIWYAEKGQRVVIIHSKIDDDEELERRFLTIEDNLCDVIVSVNMLMEGYDHKYLTVLALFRPYRSLNAFAQVVGRVLRAIPDDEITDFAIDNNAVVIYHEETGLDAMWKHFAQEVDKSKKIPIKEYSISETEYTKREVYYANVEIGDGFVSDRDSYLSDIDFNEMFENARKTVESEITETIAKLKAAGLGEKEIEVMTIALRKETMASQRKQIDELLLAKRPEQLRKKVRQFLTVSVNEAVQELLESKGIDPKASTLYNKFKGQINGLSSEAPNDGILVRYVNARVYSRYGPVKTREPETLLLSKKYMNQVIEELGRMI